MTTRTISGIKFIKADADATRAAGALSLWLTEDSRFELRGDDLLEMTDGERGGIEWGVWDREAGREGDWADGGRGNGVDSMADGAALIASVLADEAREALKAKCPALVAQIEAQGLDKADEDPNAERTAYLEAELRESVGYLTKSILALEKAKQQADQDIARMEKIKKELDGLAALKAREDAWHAANS